MSSRIECVAHVIKKKKKIHGKAPAESGGLRSVDFLPHDPSLPPQGDCLFNKHLCRAYYVHARQCPKCFANISSVNPYDQAVRQALSLSGSYR